MQNILEGQNMQDKIFINNIFPNLAEYSLNLNSRKLISYRFLFIKQLLKFKHKKAIRQFENWKHFYLNSKPESLAIKYNNELIFLNTFQYFYISNIIEFLTLSYSVIYSKNIYLRKNYIRYLAIVLFESMEDLEKLRGEKYKSIIEEYADEELKNNIKDTMRQIRILTKKHKDEIRLIRNKIGAHKELNIDIYEKYLNEIDDIGFITFASVYMSYISNISAYTLLLYDKIVKNSF